MQTTSIIISGIIILVAVVVIWKWWKTPHSNTKKNDDIPQQLIINEEISINTNTNTNTSDPPPMVFAVNDGGFLDLSDIEGKILNISFGNNQKTYVILLDSAEKDCEKEESENGITFKSKVGNTKLYQVTGKQYIINYTRL
jgi:hypothetical protein